MAIGSDMKIVVQVAECNENQITLSAKNMNTGDVLTMKVPPSAGLEKVFEVYKSKKNCDGSVQFVNGKGNILHPKLQVSMLKGGGDECQAVVVNFKPKKSNNTM